MPIPLGIHCDACITEQRIATHTFEYNIPYTGGNERKRKLQAGKLDFLFYQHITHHNKTRKPVLNKQTNGNISIVLYALGLNSRV
jgi:hypothetical protein